MKALRMLIWLMQLGLSVAFPLGGFIVLAVWLRRSFDLGAWVLILGIILGFAGAIDGLRTSLKAMERLSREDKGEKHGYTDIHHS